MGSALVVALGLQIGDPIIGLLITAVILRITWQSLRTVQRDPGTGPHDHAFLEVRQLNNMLDDP